MLRNRCIQSESRVQVYSAASRLPEVYADNVGPLKLVFLCKMGEVDLQQGSVHWEVVKKRKFFMTFAIRRLTSFVSVFHEFSARDFFSGSLQTQFFKTFFLLSLVPRAVWRTCAVLRGDLNLSPSLVWQQGSTEDSWAPALFVLRHNAWSQGLVSFVLRQEWPPRGDKWLDNLSGNFRRSGEHSGWQAYEGRVGALQRVLKLRNILCLHFAIL